MSEVVNWLYQGFDSIPRIKKIATESLKTIKDKTGDNFEALLQYSFKDNN